MKTRALFTWVGCSLAENIYKSSVAKLSHNNNKKG